MFRILLRGENFLLESEGAVKRFGFYTTRFVEAPNETEAEALSSPSGRMSGCEDAC